MVGMVGYQRFEAAAWQAGHAWVDTHAHLDAPEFEGDSDATAQRAAQAGVAMVVLPAVSVATFDAVRQLAHQHGWAYTLGIHPMAAPQAREGDLDTLAQALEQHRDDPQLVAVGEIGLDGFDAACTKPEAMARQQHHFRAQLALAARHSLPVVLHVRRAVDQVLAGLRTQPVPGGIAHAFNGSQQQASDFIAMGLRLGVGGAMTFERALRLRRLASSLPMHAIVTETDAPDIPPQWLYRTRAQRDEGARSRNESAELPRIAQVLAELRGMSPRVLAAHTLHNACAALPRLSALLMQRAHRGA